MTLDDLRARIVSNCDRLLSHRFVLRIDDEDAAIIEAERKLVASDDGVVQKLHDLLPPSMRG